MKHENLKIKMDRGTYYKSIWLELESGGSGTWTYVCHQGLAYIFIVIMDLPDAMGKYAPALFNAEVCVVDLTTISPETIASAIRNMGYEEELDFKSERDRLFLADMLRQCGSKARLWDEDGGKVKDIYDQADERHPAFRSLRAHASEYAEKNLFNESKRDNLLDTTVVNKIGETAREYMDGGSSWAALRRIKNLGSKATKEQKLVLQMYRKAGTTLGAGPVPKDIMDE
jgi:hypothetical protein